RTHVEGPPVPELMKTGSCQRRDWERLTRPGAFIRTEHELKRAQIVLAGRFRLAFAEQSADQVPVTVDDTRMNQGVARIRPGVDFRRVASGGGGCFVRHPNPKIGSKLDRSLLSLNE